MIGPRMLEECGHCGRHGAFEHDAARCINCGRRRIGALNRMCADDRQFGFDHAREYARSAGAFSDEAEAYGEHFVMVCGELGIGADYIGAPCHPAEFARWQSINGPIAVRAPLPALPEQFAA